VLAELVGVWVGAEVGDVEHAGFVASQPTPVGDLEQGGVAEGGQPALAPGRTDPGDLVVGVVEEGLQLIQGERALDRVALGLLDVHGGVPLVHHLDRVGAEPRFALAGPAVGGVGQVDAQQPDRFLVAAQGGAAQSADRAQIAEPLVQQRRAPGPWERVRVGG
jgi:hypothetical protein